MQKHLLAIVLMFSLTQVQAQIEFSNRSDLFFNSNITSGVPMAIADMNGDSLDDIIQLNNTTNLLISYQRQPDSSFTGILVDPQGQSFSNEWTMSIGDVDNDGINEILTGGVYDEVKLYRYVDSTKTYKVDFLPFGTSIFCQASNLADINNDGWLDIFICHDDGESFVWANKGDGTFELANQLIDMATKPVSDNSGNYGSVWTDFDNDGDQDLYIAKCRQGVGDPLDPRRVNMLMVNDGDNNYANEAKERNMAIGYQSWTADFQDIDNDGDMDCFITNHDFTSQLLENDGLGYFTDITAGSGINVTGLPIQGLLRDFDNDGFVDLLVSGTIQYLYKNNGDKTFTRINTVFNNDDMESCAVGDLNNDGFLDILAGYAEVFNNPTSITDKIWMNDGNSNNYLKILLKGTRSNQNGVGARIELYGPWGVQVREIRAGESYGISNTHQAVFGMADQAKAEKLIVYWPSGNVDIIEEPNANQLLQIVESDCYGVTGDIAFIGSPVICPGETLELTAPGADTYLWSTGATSQTIEASATGNYWVVLGDNSNCFARTKSLAVKFNPTEKIELTKDGNDVLCEGGQVILGTSDTDLDLTWSTGAITEELVVTTSGNYFVSAMGNCGVFYSDTINITVLDYPTAPVLENDTISNPGPATLRSTGTLTHWFEEPVGGRAFATGNELQLILVSQTTTYYAENASGTFAAAANVGQEVPQGANRYTSNQINGGLYFTALEPFKLLSVKVYTDLAGERLIEVRDLDDVVVASKLVDLVVGEQRVDLDLRVPAGSWILSTNGDVNLTNFGFFTPRMERGNEGVQYPYTIDNLVSITGSNFGETRYYYFFDWEVSEEGTYCPSERLPATVVVQQSTSTSNPTELRDWTIFPNPVDNVLNVLTEKAESTDIELALYTASGRRIFQQNYATTNRNFSTQIGMDQLPNGVYQLKIRDGITFKNKWVVILR